ncbi:hypothetical protein PV396_18790 [Streptomyces sp. ME02-8801-2C]|uniref:hypothetical protein n=1 Tax=Streptomyces sp. ME02-8801-2C TaxID=3028680 RepID=UPI0029AE3511|nr:hypothetical protein [Streptomyces sp. ME02-8801-2C]MDX3453969.1 hypothetical protein [Streptomyces sp. ME02-8801-2C]
MSAAALFVVPGAFRQALLERGLRRLDGRREPGRLRRGQSAGAGLLGEVGQDFDHRAEYSVRSARSRAPRRFSTRSVEVEGVMGVTGLVEVVEVMGVMGVMDHDGSAPMEA